MKKLILLSSLATITLAASAQITDKKPPSTNPSTRAWSMEEVAERRAKSQEILMKKVGGLVARPGTQKGEICFVNAQNRASQGWIDEVADYFREESKFKITCKTGVFDFVQPKIEGNVTLYVIDDEKMPVLLVAPADRWAFVNVAKIAKKKRPAFFEARTKKQLSRGFAYLCGAANSQFPMALTRGMTSDAELDENMDYRLPVDLFQRFRTYLAPLGVTPKVLVIYRKAVQEGWAPVPTNEYQKAIWDKVHAVPSKPIKIEFDPKKGR